MATINAVRVRPRRKLYSNTRNTLTAVGFLLPNIVGFLAFTAIPVVASLIISLYDWPVLGKHQFIGLDNYIRLFTGDPLFLKVMGNTFLYVIFYVTFNFLLAMALAVWLTTRVSGRQIYRSVFFIPQVTPVVAMAMIWRYMFMPKYGLINNVLSIVGIPDINWLGDMKMAMPAIIIMSVWQGFGYNMVIFIAGLLGVPASQKEAAKIDGAGGAKVFFHITLPLMSPSIFFAIVMTVISSFQVFDQTLIMTAGGPGNATNTIVLYLYQNAFTYLKMGYASSMAWVLFALIMIVTAIQMVGQRNLVYYE
ncbi:sugar ABC transporter permease [Spirochaetia bacterium]|nr:sugar ABC transporter permease [Spirochaetia bacterium]